MKKIMFILISFFIIGLSYAWNFSINSDIEWKTLYLDEWVNTLSWNISWKHISINNYRNHNVVTWAVYDKITINCKNWYVNSLTWYKSIASSYSKALTLLSDNIESLNLSVGASNSWSGDFAVIKCKPITKPVKQFEEKALNINYQTISTLWNNAFTGLNLSNPASPKITKTKTQELQPWKNITTQPTFIDILYLQLKTIWSLSDSILTTNPNLDFSNLFENTSNTWFNFIGYSHWLNKFSVYTTKKQFQDAFTWAIWLKDIWIADDVIKWLYKCALNNNCLHTIHITHDINDKYSTYNFKEIEKSLYSGSNNILENSISYYNKLKSTCSAWSLTNTFLKNQVNSVCNQLFTDQINVNNPENYNLWYSLWIRVKNLNTIKNNIWTWWINLKGIFNIYRELNNLTFGTSQATIIKKITKSTTLTWQYNWLKKILWRELNELNSKKISNDDLKIILKSNIKILKPNNPILRAIEEQAPNIDLTNKNDFEIVTTTNGWEIVKPKWVNLNTTNISSLKDLAKISDYSGEVKIIFLSKKWNWKDSIWFYKENDWKPTRWKIIIKNTSNNAEVWKVIYEWKLEKDLFIVSNGNINKWDINFKKCIIKWWTSAWEFRWFIARAAHDVIWAETCTNSKYKINRLWNTIFFDNKKYNYNKWQQFKIELHDWYALVKIEDVYNWDYNYNDIILKIIPISD